MAARPAVFSTGVETVDHISHLIPRLRRYARALASARMPADDLVRSTLERAAHEVSLANAAGDPGSPALLQSFAEWRAVDRSGVVRFTDGLVKLFADSRPGVGLLRNLGLLLFDLAPPAKSALARVSAGFGGPTPRLARGLAVQRASRS